MDMRYLKDMPIAILGAGAVGKTMAADCAMGGKEVRLWDQPRFAKTNFTNIEKTGITLSGNQFSYFGFQRKGNVKIALATNDMAKAVKGAGIIIVATVDSKTGKVLAGPDLVSRGFVYVRENESLMDGAQSIVETALDRCVDEHVRDWNSVKTRVREALSSYIYRRTKRSPMILPILMEV